ncbi:hypothetical protein FACS189452_07710 [Bacteroidia bacterium]|nr:hypothetical protein FACS189452_07710 [Bacteroidia bacterium]
MENIISQWLSVDNIKQAKGNTREEIFEIFGNKLMPIYYISPAYLKYFDKNITDNRVYSGMGYFIDHAINNHPEVKIEKYNDIQDILNNPDDVKRDDRKDITSLIFIKQYDKYFQVIVSLDKNSEGKIIFHKSYYYRTKKPYASLPSIRLNPSLVGGTSTISHTDNSVPAVLLSGLNDDFSANKVTTNFSEKQEIRKKI